MAASGGATSIDYYTADFRRWTKIFRSSFSKKKKKCIKCNRFGITDRCYTIKLRCKAHEYFKTYGGSPAKEKRKTYRCRSHKYAAGTDTYVFLSFLLLLSNRRPSRREIFSFRNGFEPSYTILTFHTLVCIHIVVVATAQCTGSSENSKKKKIIIPSTPQ